MYFKFILEHDLGGFGMTKSSQAFNAYRHRFMSQGIFIHDEDEVIELERQAYHGGRNECYHIGSLNHQQYVCLDINSMYPFIMSKEKLPTMLTSNGTDMSLTEASGLLDEYAVISECLIETDKPIYAVKKNGKLVFPIGKFTAFLCSGGLNIALENGHVKSIKRFAVYEKANLFKQYVDYFYELRTHYKDNSNKIYAELCKYFMNTLYGKFGQQKSITQFEEDITFEGYYRERTLDIPTMEWVIYTKLLNKIWVEQGVENAKNTIVAIPAHITEYGRIILYNLIKEAGFNEVLYCDTDSIIGSRNVSHSLSDKLHDKELGKLKVEYTTEHLTIHGCKDYETDQHVKIKGVPKSAEKVSANSYKYTQFLGQSSHLAKKIDDAFIIRPILKVNKRIYDKGVVHADGRVSPISLADV